VPIAATPKAVLISISLMKYLDDNGIAHNSRNKGDLHLIPAGSSATPTPTVPKERLNYHNGMIAAEAIAQEHQAKPHTKVQKNVMVDTPKGRRDVDILVTRHQGTPKSEEIRIESKLGKQNLPSVAKGSNIRAQIDKDVAALAEHRTKAPIPHAVGRTMYWAGKVARPLGTLLSGVEIHSAFQADGNKVGIHTVSKVAGIAGGAVGGILGGAALGAALGSVVPVAGTAIGAVLGGATALVGSMLGGLAGEAFASNTAQRIGNWFSG